MSSESATDASVPDRKQILLLGRRSHDAVVLLRTVANWAVAGRLRFHEPAYRVGETALLLLDAHNKSSTDISEVTVRLLHILAHKLCEI